MNLVRKLRKATFRSSRKWTQKVLMGEDWSQQGHKGVNRDMIQINEHGTADKKGSPSLQGGK